MPKIQTSLEMKQLGTSVTYQKEVTLPSSPPSGSVYELQRADYILTNTFDPPNEQNLPVVGGFFGLSATSMPTAPSGDPPHLSNVFNDGVYAFSAASLFSATGARDLTSTGSFKYDRRGVQMPVYGVMVPEPGSLRAFVSNPWVFGIFEDSVENAINLNVVFRLEYSQRKAKPGEIEQLLLMCAC